MPAKDLDGSFSQLHSLLLPDEKLFVLPDDLLHALDLLLKKLTLPGLSGRYSTVVPALRRTSLQMCLKRALRNVHVKATMLISTVRGHYPPRLMTIRCSHEESKRHASEFYLVRFQPEVIARFALVGSIHRRDGSISSQDSDHPDRHMGIGRISDGEWGIGNIRKLRGRRRRQGKDEQNRPNGHQSGSETSLHLQHG